MDPQALLDYALFQLTPTRTRCDLVIFSGAMREKLASGLVEPFVCHLKFAKDQIPKGGYSITLRPPKSNAYWFTKATFQRFVRFVSTPEILERFTRLEKEILQIESSVQPNEISNGNVAGQAEEGSLSTANGITKQSTNSSKPKGEQDGHEDDVQEENSKVHLQRLLETRKVLLRKEQAMAYARALVAGFELEYIDDLILFADAFGASRLREACTDFKELCKKKHSDGVWMDELAAMQAYSQTDLSFAGTSGIILTPESNPSFQNNMLHFQSKLMSNSSLEVSSDSTASQDNTSPASDQTPSNPAKVQVQMPYQIPPYMFNFQNSPYQAYPFPGMQPGPPYYPGNMHWPQNPDEPLHALSRESGHHQHRRSSSRRKEKSPNAEKPGTSEEDDETDSSDSEEDTGPETIAFDDRKHPSNEQPYKKKHKKKSSKTVVIRNINYITSKRRDEEKDGSSSVEDALLDGDSIRQKVEDVVGSLEKHHKPTSKKRGESKSPELINGFNGSADQEPENGRVTNVAGGGKGLENWDAFQNLLMSEKESTTDSISSTNVQFESERVHAGQTFGTDSFVVNGRTEVNEGGVKVEDFGNEGTLRPSMRRTDSPGEVLLFPQRSEESGRNLLGAISNCGTESSIIKYRNGEDWFVMNHSGSSGIREGIVEQIMLNGSLPNMEMSKKIVPVDDSFMVQAQTSYDDHYGSHWKTDISMVSDLIVPREPEKGNADDSKNKNGVSGAHEPDDLSVVLARDPGFESIRASWSPEMVDYGVEASFVESNKKSSVVEINDQMEEKVPVKNAKSPNNSEKQLRRKSFPGSVSKARLEALSKSKQPFSANRNLNQKSKLEKEEVARRRIEELAIERQKRIAERTAASGLTPKKVPGGSKVPQSKTQLSSKLGITNSAKKASVKTN